MILQMRRWNRTSLMMNSVRNLDYEITAQQEIDPHIDFKKWDWVSQQILRIGKYYPAWDWLIDNFYDADTVITGRKGTAKTSLMLRIGEDKSLQRNVPFSVKHNVLTGRNVILTPELISSDYVPYSVITIDELQHAFHKMRSTSSANVEANRFMDLKRKWKLNVVGTMPNILSVDKDLINEKIVFWINCWRNLKRKRQIKAIIWVNLTSRDGKFRDFVKLEEKTFDYCSTSLYHTATRAWEKVHGDVMSLEDFKLKLKREVDNRQKLEKSRRVRDILSYTFLSDEEKCYLLLEEEYAKIKIEKQLGKGGRFVSGCESDIEVNPDLLVSLHEKVLLHIGNKDDVRGDNK